MTSISVKDATGATVTVPVPTPNAITATLTVTNGAYTAGDAVGGLITFTNAADANGKSLMFEAVELAGCTSAIPLELWLLNADLATPVADNAAFATAAADDAKVLGVIYLEALDYKNPASGAYVATKTCYLPVKCAAGTRNIYAYLKHTTTTSPGTTTLKLTANFLQRD